MRPRSGIVRFADMRIMAKAFMNDSIVAPFSIGPVICGNALTAPMREYAFHNADTLTTTTMMIRNTVRTAFRMSIRIGLESTMDNKEVKSDLIGE